VGALALAPAPATVPAFGEENERVDVVIVLQDDQPADAALLPSSAPANLAPDAQPAEPEPAESPAADPAQAPQQSPAAEPPVVDSPAP
jgi:hypothetical protein